MKLHSVDLEDLKCAKSLLEDESFAIKIADIIGKPIEYGLDKLPAKAHKFISDTTTKALNTSLKSAIITMSKKPSASSRDKVHKLVCATSGGAGGFFGLPALVVELPMSTTIMLRSIADIARSEGAMISSSEIQLECISIFALGGPSSSDDAAESGYYATRAALAQSIQNAAEHIAKEGLTKEGAPAIVKLIAEIAARFNIQISQKAAAQAVPLIGMGIGALINTIFIDHFQDKARGHFIIRRLERKYGIDVIAEVYKEI